MTAQLNLVAARAVQACAEEHVLARGAVPCVICGADVGAECMFGVHGPLPAITYPGKVHLRRLKAYFASVGEESGLADGVAP